MADHVDDGSDEREPYWSAEFDAERSCSEAVRFFELAVRRRSHRMLGLVGAALFLCVVFRIG